MSQKTALPRWLTPITVAFALSLLLTLIARLGSEVNRDGMLYIATAQAFLDGGFAAAKHSFAWPFLPIAIAAVSKLTGLGLENAAYLLNALFMAGTCALIVACVARKSPDLAWPCVLIVLAIPGTNEYRNELLREFGSWFFIMLTWWLALRWDERPQWFGAFTIQASLACAALFRPEAFTLFGALICWQFFAAPRQERWKRLAMIGLIPTIGGTFLLIAFFSGHLDGRLNADLGRFGLTRFDEKAEALAASLIEYAHGQARTILFFGSLALIPIKLINKFSLFLIPLAYFFISGNYRDFARRHALFSWGIAAHLLVLSVFVLDLQFLSGRYVGLILLLSTPFIAEGFNRLILNFPRWQKLIFAIVVLMAAANVVSTGSGKEYFVEAGKWLAANANTPDRIYIDSGRTAYHAGWLKLKVAERNQREDIAQAASTDAYDYYALEVSRKDPPWNPDLDHIGLQIIQRFEAHNGDAVIIARPKGVTSK